MPWWLRTRSSEHRRSRVGIDADPTESGLKRGRDRIFVDGLLDPHCPLGHKTKLQQLFQNLISNAVKFIDKDKGLIQIDFKEEKDHFEFSIKDNGMGIEKKFFDKIFKIFHSLNKNKESTGIGLSIVKKIVDLHEGKIWLESELEKGTTFYFTLKK